MQDWPVAHICEVFSSSSFSINHCKLQSAVGAQSSNMRASLCFPSLLVSHNDGGVSSMQIIQEINLNLFLLVSTNHLPTVRKFVPLYNLHKKNTHKRACHCWFKQNCWEFMIPDKIWTPLNGKRIHISWPLESKLLQVATDSENEHNVMLHELQWNCLEDSSWQVNNKGSNQHQVRLCTLHITVTPVEESMRHLNQRSIISPAAVHQKQKWHLFLHRQKQRDH